MRSKASTHEKDGKERKTHIQFLKKELFPCNLYVVFYFTHKDVSKHCIGNMHCFRVYQLYFPPISRKLAKIVVIKKDGRRCQRIYNQKKSSHSWEFSKTCSLNEIDQKYIKIKIICTRLSKEMKKQIDEWIIDKRKNKKSNK